MPLVDELEESGDFDFGPDGGSGVISFFVLQAASQDEAADAALADPRAAENINGYQRGRVAVKFRGGNYYAVTIDYQRGVPSKAADNAGQSPAGQQTPGKEPNEPLPRDVSFSTGGATRKRYTSLETRHRLATGDATAPSFGGLIGVDVDGGKVEGCEVVAPASDFTITKRFPLLTVGWYRNMLSTVGRVNGEPYLGLDTGEVLFKGCDGQYKDDDKSGYPWTVTGRFGFSPNKTIEENEFELTFHAKAGDIRVPDVRGWNFVWVVYEKTTESVTIGGVARDYIVQRPLFVYVESVYEEDDFNDLNLN